MNGPTTRLQFSNQIDAIVLWRERPVWKDIAQRDHFITKSGGAVKWVTVFKTSCHPVYPSHWDCDRHSISRCCCSVLLVAAVERTHYHFICQSYGGGGGGGGGKCRTLALLLLLLQER